MPKDFKTILQLVYRLCDGLIIWIDNLGLLTTIVNKQEPKELGLEQIKDNQTNSFYIENQRDQLMEKWMTKL